jgi:NTE family protein
MAPVFDWLHSAVGKFREFAYAEERPGASRPRVGLALSGGFARGIAHIGVLRVLEQAGIPIDCISGTSSGSLIAAGYAAGVSLEAMEKVATETSFTDFGRFTPSWLGLATNKRLEGYLARMTPLTTFEEMKIPLAISATDLKEGIAVYYTSGPIGPALRGSCAYPGLFVPIEYDGRKLVDGFLTAPVPVEGAALLGADIVIAAYLEAGSVAEPRTVADVISRSFTIIQRHADIGWRQSADVIIEPDVRDFVWDDFSKVPALIAHGEAAALRALPRIREVMAEAVEEAAS